MADEVKQVIVVDESLRLPRGKLAAQVAHASVAALLETQPSIQRSWFEIGMPKIVLGVESSEELEALAARAADRGIPSALVRDAGRTVVDAGTATCLGLGPTAAAVIDELTGELRLVR